MNKIEYLLTCVQEECGEIIQIAAKCQRFGVDNYHPNDPTKKRNEAELQRELDDLDAVRLMLANEGVMVGGHKDYHQLVPKMQKVEHYMKVSRECKTLDE